MSNLKLHFTIIEPRKEAATLHLPYPRAGYVKCNIAKEAVIEWKTESGQSVASITVNQDGLGNLIGHLMGLHARLQVEPDISPERVASGYAKTPPPLEYIRMMAGRSTKSGLPKISFEIGQQIWNSFVLRHPDAEALSSILMRYLENPHQSGTQH